MMQRWKMGLPTSFQISDKLRESGAGQVKPPHPNQKRERKEGNAGRNKNAVFTKICYLIKTKPG